MYEELMFEKLAWIWVTERHPFCLVIELHNRRSRHEGSTLMAKGWSSRTELVFESVTIELEF